MVFEAVLVKILCSDDTVMKYIPIANKNISMARENVSFTRYNIQSCIVCNFSSFNFRNKVSIFQECSRNPQIQVKILPFS